MHKRTDLKSSGRRNLGKLFASHQSLLWPTLIALKLASKRRAGTIEVSDLMTGIYIAEFEHLSRFWEQPEQFEHFAVNQLGCDKPRWFYWCELYNYFKNRREEYFKGHVHLNYSRSASIILAKAVELAQRGAGRKRTLLAEVRAEHFLLAICRLENIPLCQQIVNSGLDAKGLEQFLRDLRADRSH